MSCACLLIKNVSIPLQLPADILCPSSDVLHPNRANVSKDELRQKLAELYKANKDQVSCFGFRTQYGGGKSTGFALVYDSHEVLKKFEPHYRLVRYGIATKIEKASRQQRTYESISLSMYCHIEEHGLLTMVSFDRQATQEPSQDSTRDCEDKDRGQGQKEVEKWIFRDWRRKVALRYVTVMCLLCVCLKSPLLVVFRAD